MLNQNQHFDVIANNAGPPYPNAWPILVIPTGCGMFLSHKAVQGIVEEWNKDHTSCNYEHPDDVMIGILLGSAGFHNIANYNYDIVLPYMEINNRFFHLRWKIFNEPILRVIHG